MQGIIIFIIKFCYCVSLHISLCIQVNLISWNILCFGCILCIFFVYFYLHYVIGVSMVCTHNMHREIGVYSLSTLCYEYGPIHKKRNARDTDRQTGREEIIHARYELI